MTTTTTQRPTTVLRRLTTTATHEQRRQALIELAEQIGTEARYPQSRPFTPVIDLVVPTLAAHTVDPARAVQVFDDLVFAVCERARFVANEAEYAMEHDWATSDAALQLLSDRLLSAVDESADALMGAAS